MHSPGSLGAFIICIYDQLRAHITPPDDNKRVACRCDAKYAPWRFGHVPTLK